LFFRRGNNSLLVLRRNLVSGAMSQRADTADGPDASLSEDLYILSNAARP
jgi:hypothetical protein